MHIKKMTAVLFKKWGKGSFLYSIPINGKVLDVGCGNNSPCIVKSRRPDVVYYGLDVGNYNQSQNPAGYADKYILTPPEHFASEIAKMENTLDAVISSHNIEHCSEPDAVLAAMLRSLRRGGRLFISFPCEMSVHFPKRAGTLNFFDDSTHTSPLVFDLVLDTIKAGGFRIDFAARRYRPAIPFVMGLLLEPFSFLLRRTMPFSSTWALYGFESVIWASRLQ